MIALNQFTTFIIGAGGFGGKRTSEKIVVCTETDLVGVLAPCCNVSQCDDLCIVCCKH